MTSMTNLLANSLLVAGCERQQSNVAGLLDGTRQPSLVRRADSGEASRYDLAPLRDKLLQQAHIAIVDGVDLLDTEFANFLAAKELASASARAARASARRASART
jgi:hypothetical protein